MRPRTAQVIISVLFSIALTMLTGCGSATHAPTTAPSISGHKTLEMPVSDARVAAVLIASNRAMGDLGKTIDSIEQAIRVVENNMENAETIGFKADIEKLNGNAPPYMSIDMTQGSLENTGQPLDVGIQGEGFIAVKMPADVGGVAYTRCGNFTLNNVGNLILAIGDGLQLCPPITLPTNATNITIGTDGTVMYIKPGTTSKVTAGQIKLTRFTSPSQLYRYSATLLCESPGSGPPTYCCPGTNGAGQILSGYLENSNVQLSRERLRVRFLNQWRDALIDAADAKRVH